MVNVVHKYVKRVTRRRRRKDGSVWKRVYYYFWYPGAPDHSVRLPDDPASPEFIGKLQCFTRKAVGASAAADPNSFAALVVAYRTSPEFTGLRPRTRKDYEYYLERLVREFGHLPFSGITRDVVYRLRDRHKDNPHVSRHVISALRRALSWAVERGRLKENPAAGVKQLSVRPRFQVWSQDDEKRFLECATPPMALGFRLGIYTAQRLGDIVAMTWAQYRGGKIRLRQEKTGELVWLPCHPELLKALEDTPRISTHILTSAKGRPFVPNNFSHQWQKAMAKVGIEGLQFRDLRRTALVRMAEAGCTTPEIAAVSGHSIDQTQRILETYIPRTAKMAEAAIHKYARRETES